MHSIRKLVIDKKEYTCKKDELKKSENILLLINKDPLINSVNLSRMQLTVVFKMERMLCFENIVNLNLSRNNLCLVPNMSKLTNLKRLNLSHNRIEMFPYHLPESLEYLNFRSNRIKDVSHLCYHKKYELPNLKELNINKNVFKNLDGFYSLFPNLEYFWFNLNKYESFPTEIFRFKCLKSFFVETYCHDIFSRSYIRDTFSCEHEFEYMPCLEVIHFQVMRNSEMNFNWKMFSSCHNLKKLHIGSIFPNVIKLKLEWTQGKLTSVASDDLQTAINFGVKEMDLSQLKFIRTKTDPDSVKNMLSVNDVNFDIIN